MNRLSVKPEMPAERWRREDLALPVGCTALYRMWGTIGGLLYVGITGNLIERWRRHAQKAPWWPEVDLITYETYPKEHLALAAERSAIRTERPAFNIRSATSEREELR